MGRRSPQQREVLLIRDLAGELHARQVDPAVQLAQHALAVGFSGRQARRVAHLVAADDHDPRVRPALLDLRDGAHEDVEAAIGLEVAGDIRNQFFPGFSGGDHIGVDAIVDHAHA